MYIISNPLCSRRDCSFNSLDSYVQLVRQVLPGNSLVPYTAAIPISLRCVTPREDCCGSDSNAQWDLPNGGNTSIVGNVDQERSGVGEPLGFVTLTINDTLNSQDQGIYRCTVPEPGIAINPTIISHYVGIYNTDQGKFHN